MAIRPPAPAPGSTASALPALPGPMAFRPPPRRRHPSQPHSRHPVSPTCGYLPKNSTSAANTRPWSRGGRSIRSAGSCPDTARRKARLGRGEDRGVWRRSARDFHSSGAPNDRPRYHLCRLHPATERACRDPGIAGGGPPTGRGLGLGRGLANHDRACFPLRGRDPLADPARRIGKDCHRPESTFTAAPLAGT